LKILYSQFGVKTAFLDGIKVGFMSKNLEQPSKEKQ